MKNFDEYILGEILKEEGIELSDQEIKQLIAEGFMDKMKKWGKNAALAGALGAGAMGAMGGGGQAPQPHAQPQAQVQTQQAQFDQSKFDNYNQEKPTMSDQEWKQMAGQYPASGKHGFVPNPNITGQWIPAGGADSVRVQSRTEVDNDELARDDIGLTPWKDGKAMGSTNWSHMGKAQTPHSSYGQGRTTTTPIDGQALYRQAMNMGN